MAYYRSEAPKNEALNASLLKDVTALNERADALYALADRVETMSRCQHVWQKWIDESYDGHRSDRSDEYTCTLCGYDTKHGYKPPPYARGLTGGT